MKAEKNMTVQDLIDELMLVKDKSKEIRVVVNTNDYITSYPASLFDMSDNGVGLVDVDKPSSLAAGTLK